MRSASKARGARAAGPCRGSCSSPSTCRAWMAGRGCAGCAPRRAPRAARAALAANPPDLALVDLGLPDGSGLELLRQEDRDRSVEFVVVTGNATVETAVAALREGALDYLVKPIDRSRLRSVLSHVARTR